MKATIAAILLLSACSTIETGSTTAAPIATSSDRSERGDLLRLAGHDLERRAA